MKIDNNKLSREELIEKEKAVVARICSDDDFAYYFFHENVVLCLVRYFGRYLETILITTNL